MVDLAYLLTMDAEHPFKPMVVTYAITSSVIVDDTHEYKQVEFNYALVGIETGFEDAVTAAAPSILQLVQVEGGIQPAPPTIKYIRDPDTGLLIEVELRHPSYSPYNSNVPLMFIVQQLIDDEIEDTKSITVRIPKNVSS